MLPASTTTNAMGRVTHLLIRATKSDYFEATQSAAPADIS
jgi:hypothetical protein